MKRLFLHPYNSDTNEYTDLQINTFKRLGYSVNRLLFKDLVNGNIRKPDLIIVNWFEHVLLDTRGKLKIRGLRHTAMLLLCRIIFRPKLIYIRHNIRAHSAGSGVTWLLCNLIIKLVEFCSSEVVTHSKTQNNTYFIPHPLYSRALVLEEEFSEPIRYTVFGAIKPYKGIDSLLGIWPTDVKLEIVGRVTDQYLAYLDEIIAMRQLSVVITNKFMTEDELAQLLQNTDIVVLPHAKDTAIVSGAFFHAKTYGCMILKNKTDVPADYGETTGVFEYKDVIDLQSTIHTIDSHARSLNRLDLYERSLATNGHDYCDEYWRNLLDRLNVSVR